MFEYENAMQYWINRAAIALRQKAQSDMKAKSISLSAEEWALLMVLWRHGATATSHLADVTLKDRTTVTRLVDRLVDKKYVERQISTKDKRSSLIALTPEGEAIKHEVFAVMMPLIAKSCEGIKPEDIETTMTTLKQVFSNLSDDQ